MEKLFKVCTKCNKELKANTDNFSRNKTKKHGLQSQCKECLNNYNKQYHQNNKDKINILNKQYNLNNKDKIKLLNKKYRENNKEKLREYHKEYQKNNKETRKQYRQENKKKIRLSNKEYQKKSCDKLYDCYIKEQLRQQGFTKFTKELIEAKRQIIKIGRTIKQKQL